MKPELTKPSLSSSSMEQQQQPRSPWHSPVPYLFGGLAAMLGLIAFALLILACSYWRLSGRNATADDVERDVESGEKLDDGDGDFNKRVMVYEEKFVVIMAGEEKPTFLATPVSNKASIFTDENGQKEEKEGLEELENGEKGSKEDEEKPTITENSERHES